MGGPWVSQAGKQLEILMQENYCNLRSQFFLHCVEMEFMVFPYIQNQEFPRGCSFVRKPTSCFEKPILLGITRFYFLKEMVIFNYCIILLSRKINVLSEFQEKGEL